MVQLVSGAKVQTPLGGDTRIANGHTIRHGVELDAQGRTAAYWVKPDDGTDPQRIPAKGATLGPPHCVACVRHREETGRRARRAATCRWSCNPLKEIDRYRDSVQRKAVINSILAMFIKKTEDKQGTRPMTGGAVRRGQATTTDLDGGKREFNIAEPSAGPRDRRTPAPGKSRYLKAAKAPTRTSEPLKKRSFRPLRGLTKCHRRSCAWRSPTTTARAQAAINEFKIYLNKVWSDWGETFCQPVYIEWLLAENLKGRISSAGTS